MYSEPGQVYFRTKAVFIHHVVSNQTLNVSNCSLRDGFTVEMVQALTHRSGKDWSPLRTTALRNRGWFVSRLIDENRSRSTSRTMRHSKRDSGAPRAMMDAAAKRQMGRLVTADIKAVRILEHAWVSIGCAE